MRRGVLTLIVCGLVLVCLASPARAGRTARISISTAGPSASTAVPTNVMVYLGAADYQPPEPTGDVAVTDNGKMIGTAVPGSCGSACGTFKYTFEAGSHSLVAHYGGDSNFDAVDSDPDAFTLSPYGVVTKLVTADRNVDEGAAVTFHASVTGDRNDGATLLPTGTVTLEDRTYDCKSQVKDLATVALDQNREASFATSSLPACNRHIVYARYNGDRNYHDYGTYDGFTNVQVNARSSPGTSGAVPTTGRGTVTSMARSPAGLPADETTTSLVGGPVLGAAAPPTSRPGASSALDARYTGHDSGTDSAPFVIVVVMVVVLAAGASLVVRRRLT